MARFTQKEFADECGVGTNYLSSYKRQGYLNVGEDGYIDSEDPVNARFLAKRLGKPPKEKKPKGEQDAKNPIDPKTGEELPTYEESERLVKYFDSKKREKEVEKLQIEIDKKRGEVIPSELIIPLFLQHNKSIITSFKNVCDAILTEYGKKKSFSSTEMADMRGRMIASINEGIHDAQDLTKSAVKVIIADYSEKRGVGERVNV